MESKLPPVLLAACLLAACTLTACENNEPLTTEEIVAAVSPSTVLVKAFNDGEPAGSGSGWVIDAQQGLVATNFHVTAAGDDFAVSLDREGKKRPAKLQAAAPCEDIAVLKVRDTGGFKSMPVADQSQLRTGQKVVTLGFPGNVAGSDQLQVTEGIISIKRTKLEAGKSPVRGWNDYPNLVQIDAALNPGNSGGPTVNEEGALVGMNTFIGQPGQSYAIGSERLKTLLPSMGRGESKDWAGFGFTFVDEDLVVTSVFPGTSAAGQQMQPGELILTLNGQGLYNLADYCEAVRGSTGGSIEALAVWDPEGLDYYSDYGTYRPNLVFNE